MVGLIFERKNLVMWQVFKTVHRVKVGIVYILGLATALGKKYVPTNVYAREMASAYTLDMRNEMRFHTMRMRSQCQDRFCTAALQSVRRT